MISLSQYARDVFQYATKEAQDHIAETVLYPLGLASDEETAKSYLSVFASPPATTNFRFTGSRIAERASAACAEASGTPSHYFSEAMTHIGLPYCVCLHPVAAEIPEWPPILSVAAEAQRQDSTDRAATLKQPVVVVVDTGCAEAVLRGAHVFLPGIRSISHTFTKGQEVLLGVYLEKTFPGAAAASASPTFRFKFPTRHSLPPEILQRRDTEGGKGVGTEKYLVLLGQGVANVSSCALGGRDLHGVVVEVTWTPFLQPSLATLEKLAKVEGQPQSQDLMQGTSVFLQNYSSMVPVQLLVNRLLFPTTPSKPLMLFDACAAPGGKTSLLLSLMKDASERHAPGLPDGQLRLVCCERSPRRHAALVALLQSHFPESGSHTGEGQVSSRPPFLSQTLRALPADANKLPAALAQADPSLDPIFDGILLDPPCSGMGLRPRVLPHLASKKLIADHADYQRALFRSCMRYLRTDAGSAATLVYSTCTITVEENEANVLHFLQAYPSLRLARARNAAEAALCAMSTVGNYGGGKRFLLEEDIMALQKEREGKHPAGHTDANPVLVLRFMPRPRSTPHVATEDGVGFFVAVFELASESGSDG